MTAKPECCRRLLYGAEVGGRYLCDICGRRWIVKQACWGEVFVLPAEDEA